MPFNPNKLTRVTLRSNPAYARDGRKSYAYALQKFNIGPTLEGPFAMIDEIQQNGSQTVMQKVKQKVGGKAYLKGQKLAMRNAAGQMGDVPADNIQHDSEYIAQVAIGTPAQNMNLDFDTGSSDLWVWSNSLPATITSQAQGTGHNVFNTEKSSSWKPMPGSTWQIQYGDGSGASGTVGKDTLLIGGVSVENQAIETANKISAQFQKNASDGLLGLAWGNINTVKPVPVQTPVENMISQADIPKTAELFTAYLTSWRDQQEPYYTFGYIDQAPVTASKGPIHYVDINNSQGFWQFNSPSAVVNGRVIDRSLNTAIADTGTTLALVADNVCEAIYAAIPGAYQDKTQQGWLFPTSVSVSKLPVVQVAVGSTLFTIHPSDLQFANVGSQWWYGGIQSRGDLPFDILGDTFLKNVYAIFDQGNTRFGCVQRYQSGETPTAGSPAAPSGNGTASAPSS